MSPFEAARRLLEGSVARAPLGEQVELVFQDADLVPLLVQENYVNHRPNIAGGDEGKVRGGGVAGGLGVWSRVNRMVSHPPCRCDGTCAGLPACLTCGPWIMSNPTHKCNCTALPPAPPLKLHPRPCPSHPSCLSQHNCLCVTSIHSQGLSLTPHPLNVVIIIHVCHACSACVPWPRPRTASARGTLSTPGCAATSSGA